MATTCREVTPPARVHHRLHKAAGRWGGEVDDSELDVFAAERYFNGDDASSSSFSSAFRTGTHEHGLSSLATVTAATSSSEASWNSRSGLLPDGKVAAAAAPGIEAEPQADGKPSSSHLRRWMLGVAGCACIGVVGGDTDSYDEVEQDNVVGGQEEELITKDDEAGKALFGRRGESKEEFLAVGEATSVRVMPGRWLDDGDESLAGKAAPAFSPVQLAGDGRSRAANSAQLFTPFLNSATTATSHEQELPPLCHKKGCSSLVSTTEHSAFTIIAGNKAHGGALRAAGVGSPAAPRRSFEDDSELGCAYPPSEVSVVWSVVTAEGAASCNFSSAASGYYYHHHINPAGEDDDARRRNRRRRRSGAIANSGGGLLTCIGDKAVDTVGGGSHSGSSPWWSERGTEVTCHR